MSRIRLTTTTVMGNEIFMEISGNLPENVALYSVDDRVLDLRDFLWRATEFKFELTNCCILGSSPWNYREESAVRLANKYRRATQTKEWKLWSPLSDKEIQQ